MPAAARRAIIQDMTQSHRPLDAPTDGGAPSRRAMHGWRGSLGLVVLGLGLGLGLGAGCGAPREHTFIALDSDFASFPSWERVALGDAPLAGHPPGPRFGYLNHRAPKGADAYPLGTIVVKTVEPMAAHESWEIFAMSKRGGNFNPGGARDWEFFRLKFVGGVPHIVSRGENAFDPDVDGGGGYLGNVPGAFATLCNGCHGTTASAATDHILSAALRPGT
jgi:hypothetical protein